MVNAGQIVAALRDVGSTKSLSVEEVSDLVKDGILAGLAKIYGPNVEAEISIDDSSGDFEIIVYAFDPQTGNTGVDKVKVTVN